MKSENKKTNNPIPRYTTKAFSPLMAKAAKLTIVEAEEIVEIGELEPNDVHLPGIFVNRIVPATVEKQIEILKLREDSSSPADGKAAKTNAALGRERIGRRAAAELKEGYYVNLGVGLPTSAMAHLPPDRQVWVQSENGILGMGPYPTADQVDA